MDDMGKVLYEMWVARNLQNAIIVEEKWEELDQLDQQAWRETAQDFFNWGS